MFTELKYRTKIPSRGAPVALFFLLFLVLAARLFLCMCDPVFRPHVQFAFRCECKGFPCSSLARVKGDGRRPSSLYFGIRPREKHFRAKAVSGVVTANVLVMF